ncbi:MAG: gamma-glutamyltransferase [Phycisphaerae bacterium]|nr:gamma-glutamyltransferase [Phycisphaerae bacterium]
MNLKKCQNQSKMLYFFLILSLLSMASPVLAADRITGAPFATRSEVIAQNGIAATSHPLASQVAIDILKQGGNAIDAAIAANAMLGLVEPTGSGIGGDLFAIVWDAKTQKLYGLNASGRSPKSLTLKYFKDHNIEKIPALGPLPVSVPGCVDGWFQLHNRFGKLPMDKILAPTIDYGRKGFPVTELIAYYWQINANSLKDYPNFADIFMPGGKAPAKGEIFRNPYLADTLETIAKEGRDVFYKGKIAKVIAKHVKDNGGFLSYEDMAEHTSQWIQPVSANYRGYDIWELPPNGQGIAALEMLNILKNYDLKSKGFGSFEHLHLLTEAKKLAFEDRAKFYCDTDFNKIPVKELISPEYGKQRQQLIEPAKAGRSYPAGNPALEHGDTVYLTVADKAGNMVSLIQSNYRGMGSGMTPVGLGFILQDRGELFSLTPGQFNTYAPGKRPFHTIIPAFITKDNKPYMSFGVMGGAMQPQGHTQIVINMIDFDMDLQAAGDAARIRHSGSSQPTGEIMSDGGVLYLENGFSKDVIEKLEKAGHTIKQSKGGYGGYQAIRYDPVNKVYYGASESRKDGCAIGY